VIFAFFKSREKSAFNSVIGQLMDASILISTRNRALYLVQTLESLSEIRRDGLEVELIVIDNGSDDDTMALATEAAGRFPFCFQLLSFSRGAKAAALNYALPAATGRYLVFTDDDLRFDELWLLKLLAPLRAAQAEAVVGEIRLPPHLTRDWMEPTHRAMLAEVRPNDERHQLVGANMAISRECFDSVGAFDPALGPGALGLSEEVLLDRQIRSKGGRVRFAAGAIVEHHFDPKRLERSAWIRHAKASGSSNAYIFHHWNRGSVRWLPLRRAKRAIQAGFCTFSGRARRETGSPIDALEIEQINYLAFLKQYGIQRRTVPKYSTTSHGTLDAVGAGIIPETFQNRGLGRQPDRNEAQWRNDGADGTRDKLGSGLKIDD
jgi:glucosyl-dolichyl phosphate glucuronosyltransferase